MLPRQRRRGRPDGQPGGGGEAALRHPLHAPLLFQLRRDAQEPGRLRTLSGPFTRRKVVRIGSELDGQVARVHGAFGTPLIRRDQDAIDCRMASRCQRINEQQLHLSDGRLRLFSVKEMTHPILHQQHRLTA